MTGSRREPYYQAGEHRFVVDRCPGCGERRRMRTDQDLCGACQQGEPPRLSYAKKPALDVLVAVCVANFSRSDLLYLAEMLARASQDQGKGAG